MPSFYGFNFQNYPTVSKLFGGQGYLSSQGYQPQQPPQPMGAMTQLNPVFQQALDNYNAGMSQFTPYNPEQNEPTTPPAQQDTGPFSGYTMIPGGNFNTNMGGPEMQRLKDLGVQIMGDAVLVPKDIDLSNYETRVLLSGLTNGGGFKNLSDTTSGLKRYYDAKGA